MKTILTTFLFVLCLKGNVAFAQNKASINGSIIAEQKPLAGITVMLIRANDSVTSKISVSDKSGLYLFENIKPGKYRVVAGSAGYRKSVSPVIEMKADSQAVQVEPITIIPLPKDLGGVTVTAKRPLIEQRIDRTIVNVDASITNQGTSALEVLEKAPGVTVDREGTISLKGKDGVMVLIDGRPTQLSGADLANMLRNMNASQLDQVEIMTNPPARYDAAGNAGIINIKTKKTQTAGYNGTLSATYGQGKYPKSNEGLNFNFRENKINLFANLAHVYRRGYETLTIDRKIFNDNGTAIDKYFEQVADKNAEGKAFTFKGGVDYFINKKTTLGLSVNKSVFRMEINNNNITDILNPSKELESISRATVDNNIKWINNSMNLNFRRLLNSKGREITADLDVLDYDSRVSQYMVNSYFDHAGNATIPADTLEGKLPQNIKVYSARVDFISPLKKNTKLEAGLKSSIARTDNNARYDSIIGGSYVLDVNRSNHFIYEENINAAYVNMSGALSKKWNAQAGLRLENTNAEGDLVTTGEKFKRNYTQLFPTAYLQYKINDKNNFVLNYGRRVRRPDYQNLNPFIRFIDRYTYSQGNPNLKPQISNNAELTYNYKNTISATLNYSITNDIFNSVIEQKGQEAFSRPQNIASLKQYGFAVNANNKITKWWTSSLNLNVFHNHYEGIANQVPVSFKANSMILNGTQQFKITKALTGEINGRYRTGWMEGLMRARSVYFMGAGLSMPVLKDKGTLRLTARDIFHSQIFRASSKYGNVDFSMKEVNDSRQVAIGFSYRFSKGKKVAPVKRTAGSANEEQERIGAN